MGQQKHTSSPQPSPPSDGREGELEELDSARGSHAAPGHTNTVTSQRTVPKQGGSQAWLMLAPFFVFFLVFWVIPLAGGLRASLYSNELYGRAHFAGLEHYRELIQDARYFKALKNTLLYTAGSVLLVLPLALLLAQSLRSAFSRVRPILTFVLLLPGLTPPAVLALLFLLVFHGREGILNQVFVMPFGLPPINWLKDPAFILPALVLQAVWRWTGFITFFILAGMEAIPAALFEAAHLETNSRWRVFFTVTLPLLRHVLLFSAVYLVVDAFSLFSGSYVLLGGSGGTADAGLLLVSYTYQQAFTFGKFGTAAAMSMSVAPLLLFGLWLCFLRRPWQAKFLGLSSAKKDA
jgi:multiple sugar transport system permease protein